MTTLRSSPYGAVGVSHTATGSLRPGASRGDTEHWLAVVSLNDALTEYYRNDLRVYRAALDPGFTDEEWQAIKRGQRPCVIKRKRSP
jgi:hypothetical protein